MDIGAASAIERVGFGNLYHLIMTSAAAWVLFISDSDDIAREFSEQICYIGSRAEAEVTRTYTTENLKILHLRHVERTFGREDMNAIGAEVVGKEIFAVGSEVDSVKIRMCLTDSIDAASLEFN